MFQPKPKTCEFSHLYKDADAEFAINDLVPDRRSIVITLPEPPKKLHLIDGWGEHPDEQFFKRKKTPKRLLTLQQSAIDDIKDMQKSNRQVTLTGSKILEVFWEKVEEQREILEEEITWMKHMWYWRLYGYWYYNDGKPTYITGRHFMFLNFFYMPDVKENDGFP